jgi:glycerophosphoryl diester phosphodiesterase
LYAALLLATLALWALLWAPRPLPGVTRRAPLLIGHRGVRGSLPENSVAAFERALEAGLDGLETDVQCALGGELVLVHDAALADGRRVTELLPDDLEVAIPTLATLEELFAVARRYPGVLLNLELKTRSWHTGGLERRTVRAVRASGLAAQTLISSFNPLSLLRVRLRAPELRVALLYTPDGPPGLRSTASALLLARLLHCDALHPHESLVTPALARAAARAGVPLNVWTVNDAKRVGELLRLNVNGLMADDPEALQDAVGRAEGR